jgi:hypothetical protein
LGGFTGVVSVLPRGQRSQDRLLLKHVVDSAFVVSAETADAVSRVGLSAYGKLMAGLLCTYSRPPLF